MHRRLLALLAALIALALTVPVAATAAASPALDDAAKRALALDVLERFVPHAESYWRPSDLAEPATGRYDAVGSGVTQPRGAGGIAFAYVTLLAGRPGQQEFGGVPRETMIERTIESIRHEALTNVLSGAPYRRWGGGTWQASLETYLWAFAAHRLWDRLDADTRALVRRVVTGEANILITKPIASGEEGDTGAEDNGWNAPTPALAAIMFPDDPNADAWRQTAKRLALNASSTRADATSSELVDGLPLSEWMRSVNLHPDLTMENHGFFNPIYQQVAHETVGVAAIFDGVAGRPLPEAYSFRTETVWEQILGRLATDDGDFALTAGQDWISKDYQHLAYLSILSTRFKRADASVLESRALQLVARRQATHGSGSLLGQRQIGYETMLIERLAELWWNHTLFGPSPQPSAEEHAAERARLAGVKQFPYSDFVAARLGRAFVSMSWDPVRPLALVVPHGDAHPDDPIFSYYAPRNLLGSAGGAVGERTCACEEDRFSTAGSIGDRRFSLTAFPDGMTLLLDRGTGATFTYALEEIPGLTGERPIWTAAGAAPALGDLPGDWVNAADRLGIVVRGGAGIRTSAVGGDNRQLVITGSKDTGSGNRGAALYPLADRQRTAQLAPSVRQLETPAGWSALAARAEDGSVRLAAARWAGAATAALELSDERGAPVPEQDALLDGETARFRVALDAPASRGQTLRFLVRSAAPLRGRQDGERRALLRNPSDRAVAATVTYMPATGAARTVRRTLAPREQVVARVVDGELTLAGPELEPLLEARAPLAELIERLEAWRRDGRITTGQAAALGAAARTPLGAVDRALVQARAERPNTSNGAATARVAQAHAGRLEAAAQRQRVPDDVRTAVARAAGEAGDALGRALTEAYTVVAWLEADGPAHPGEPLTVRVALLNRGQLPARDGAVTVAGPAGWSASDRQEAFGTLAPGAARVVTTTIAPPPDATTGERAELRAELAHRGGSAEAATTVAVEPVVELTTARGLAVVPGLARPLTVALANRLQRPLTVTLAATTPDGATVRLAEPEVELPAAGSVEVALQVEGTGRTSGSDTLQVAATAAGGARASAEVAVAFSDDLARNGVGSQWPAASASSLQSAYPPALAFDGTPSTFWVAAGTAEGGGPSPERPEWLAVDLGAATEVREVTMVPRTNYGPRTYAVEVSADGESWRQVASVPAAPNGTVRTAFAPVSARHVRIVITDGWDRVRPPRNVQVASLEVR
ncbi:discoidin domain-containing protein [Conexibacter arvalis]|uniref:F5/8 type C domain-containing protein n=1 Tax=Conexibacter arvalis TaxID=912552 RepID=A0A840IEL8_9ACTN|nr:discoidin domain-containing protein [Conexibacter arvalis]MBB4663272.1 hypothetical protein [Conexibacter arvalis]